MASSRPGLPRPCHPGDWPKRPPRVTADQIRWRLRRAGRHRVAALRWLRPAIAVAEKAWLPVPGTRHRTSRPHGPRAGCGPRPGGVAQDQLRGCGRGVSPDVGGRVLPREHLSEGGCPLPARALRGAVRAATLASRGRPLLRRLRFPLLRRLRFRAMLTATRGVWGLSVELACAYRAGGQRLTGTVRTTRDAGVRDFSGTLELMRLFEDLVPIGRAGRQPETSGGDGQFEGGTPGGRKSEMNSSNRDVGG
jgi:hypothetical protein